MSSLEIVRGIWISSFMDEVPVIHNDEYDQKVYNHMILKAKDTAIEHFPDELSIHEYVVYISGNYPYEDKQDRYTYAMSCVVSQARTCSNALYIRFKAIGK